MAAFTASSDMRPETAANPASSAAFGTARPTCFNASSVAGTVQRRSRRRPDMNSPRPSSSNVRDGVDQHVAVGHQPAEDVHLVQQRRVLDDDRVRGHDGLPQPDRPVVDAAECDDRSPGPLGTEARERLCVLAFAEGRN